MWEPSQENEDTKWPEHGALRSFGQRNNQFVKNWQDSKDVTRKRRVSLPRFIGRSLWWHLWAESVPVHILCTCLSTWTVLTHLTPFRRCRNWGTSDHIKSHRSLGQSWDSGPGSLLLTPLPYGPVGNLWAFMSTTGIETKKKLTNIPGIACNICKIYLIGTFHL